MYRIRNSYLDRHLFSWQRHVEALSNVNDSKNNILCKLRCSLGPKSPPPGAHISAVHLAESRCECCELEILAWCPHRCISSFWAARSNIRSSTDRHKPALSAKYDAHDPSLANRLANSWEGILVMMKSREAERRTSHCRRGHRQLLR